VFLAENYKKFILIVHKHWFLSHIKAVRVPYNIQLVNLFREDVGTYPKHDVKHIQTPRGQNAEVLPVSLGTGMTGSRLYTESVT
jgi:hypothetical protein